MTKYKSDYDTNEDIREPEPKHFPVPPKQTETILKCGNTPGSVPLTLSVTGVDAANAVFVNSENSSLLGSVVLDTRGLVDPTIKIDFSSLISFRSTAGNFQLRLFFNLKKVCRNHKIELGTWSFEKFSNVTPGTGEYVEETDAFSFFWCECEDCPECCRYIVEVTSAYLYNIDFAVISNLSISAMAVGLPTRDED